MARSLITSGLQGLETSSSSILSSRSISKHQNKDSLALKNEIGPKYIIFMVGLPARGKSYICKKLAKYLNWCGYSTKVFNVGNRRRTKPPHPASIDSVPIIGNLCDALNVSLNRDILSTDLSSSPTHPPGKTSHYASFFDPSNEEASAFREQLALDTVDEIVDWFRKGSGKVAIHDATNSTVKRRKHLLQKIPHESGIQAIFIESICPDANVLAQNIKMKLSGPDYINMHPDEAMRDFNMRIANYEKVYETISVQEEQENMSFIKIIDVGRKVIAHHIRGYLPSQFVFYLMQIHIKKRSIWLSRHGESLFNVENRVGGDPPLTELGKQYTVALADFMKKHLSPADIESYDRATNEKKMIVWTSTLQRTIEVGEQFDVEEANVSHLRFLNEIYSGSFEGLQYQEIQEKYPSEFEDRQANKLTYRYPGGESYVDVIERLRPIIIELERMESDILVVTHQVVLRTLLAYFMATPLKSMPTMEVPLHTLYCLKPQPYGTELSQCNIC
jgi:6-phosphofructo-2-kinase